MNERQLLRRAKSLLPPHARVSVGSQLLGSTLAYVTAVCCEIDDYTSVRSFTPGELDPTNPWVEDALHFWARAVLNEAHSNGALYRGLVREDGSPLHEE